MASKSRPRPKRQPNQLADLGLFNIPDLDLADNDDDDSDIDENILESELEALLSGQAPARPTRPKTKVAPVVDIEKLAEACLKDDDDEEDENLSGDEDLLSELQNITAHSPFTENNEPPQNDEPLDKNESPERSNSHTDSSQSESLVCILKERLALYNEAMNAAKLISDSSKIRRYGRAVKTLESLIKSAKSGAAINEADIPPVVKIPKMNTDSSASANLNKPVTGLSNSGSDGALSLAAGLSNCTTLNGSQSNAKAFSNNSEMPHLSPSSKDFPTINKSELIARRDQYKVAAVQAKRSGNKDLALSHLRTVKTFDAVIEAMNNNLPVDLSNVPPPPAEMSVLTLKASQSSERVLVNNEALQTSSDMEKAALAAANDANGPEIFAAPPPPSSVLEALEQRLEKYTATKQAAEAEGNNGKVRRLQRIIKQYETAVKDYKAGKNLDFEELPTPPGFAPIPVPSPKSSVIKPAEVSPAKSPKERNKISNAQNKPNVNANNPVKKPKVQRTNTSSIGEKQLDYLLERQKLFRQAALTAKQNGDIQQAKEYLRMAKGFDSMIEATKCGLPIDATTIPTPPQLESSDFVIVEVSDCTTPNENCNQEELHENLEKDLRHQIEMCTRNKEHFLRLGDVSSASKFEKLCLESKKDLSVVQHLIKKKEPVPRFHYETRLFSMVQCHADLGDNDLEVTVERGINLPGKPDDLDSYVKLEFPIPQESPQRAKTHTVRDTNNPIFQEEFKFEFNRKSRSQLRQFKRQAIKFEVLSKGGFFKADTLLGTVTVKLSDLESKCTVHDSFNLMDGRKSVGGKLEVKLRIRDPLLVKQVEEVREKWLVIGS